jgi:hypothetical protein
MEDRDWIEEKGTNKMNGGLIEDESRNRGWKEDE